MFLFSTIIYFGDNPVGYDLYKEEDIFQFRPAVNSQTNLRPPIVTAIYINSYWMIDGIEDQEIIEQVKRIVELNELIVSLNVAS